MTVSDVLTTLRVGGSVVAECVDGRGIAAELGPRPHLHPVRTLAGVPVTAAFPDDHPWHLGVSVALQDVGGWNLWGGPTYVPGSGYVRRDDRGSIEHAAFSALDESGFAAELRWLSGAGAPLLTERRQVRAREVRHGWELALSFTLRNAGDEALELGSPATNGRSGAGYGGFFWRLPEVLNPRVRTRDAEGEEAVHGSTSPWVAVTGDVFTLALTAEPVDPWFVRLADYPGLGGQLAAREPVVLPAGGTLHRSFRALVADGHLADRQIENWAV